MGCEEMVVVGRGTQGCATSARSHTKLLCLDCRLHTRRKNEENDYGFPLGFILVRCVSRKGENKEDKKEK